MKAFALVRTAHQSYRGRLPDAQAHRNQTSLRYRVVEQTFIISGLPARWISSSLCRQRQSSCWNIGSRKGPALQRAGEGKSDLIRHLMSRAAELLVEARNQGDEKRADELKYLAGVYGAEAARLKTNSIN